MLILKMKQWWLVLFIITATKGNHHRLVRAFTRFFYYPGQSFNQPTLCPSATWNPTATTIGDLTTIQGYPDTIFLDLNNSIYLTTSALSRVEVWTEGSWTQRRRIATGLNQSRGLVVSSEGEIFVDNGVSRGRIERWI